jgi:1-aminocyclopropane-1-carboxylate deaminase/D-cysteine desulfhydrase-like pyridoxal-dependent ACC family enzyme
MAPPPRFALFEGPTPLQPMPRFCAEVLGGRVEAWIKREDLLPLAFGGNKLRNLEYLIGSALADGSDTLITSGRRWSNHARLTAAAGAKAGMVVHLVLSGPQVEPAGPGIRLARLYGATVHLLETADRGEREARVAALARDVAAAGGQPYVIATGGAGAIGAWGQVLAAREVVEQAAAVALGIDRIVLPTATGGTQAGLIVGLDSATRVSGMVVARSAEELRPVIASTVSDLGGSIAPASIELDESQIGDGYGRPTEAGTLAAQALARTEGILVDPIYTAKALAGLIDRVGSGAWDGERIGFWHSGGAPGLFEPLD